MSSSRAQLPVIPSIRPNTPPSASMSFASSGAAVIPARNAVSLYKRYCTPRRTKGPRHAASTPSRPNTPMAFFTTPAPASTLPAASERMRPTTGMAPTAERVTCTVSASAEVLTAPDRVR